MRLSPPAKRKEYRDHHTSWISSVETLTRRMVYGERINELLEHTDVDATPDVDYYNHADKLDSVMVMAESDGDQAESYRYKEYGEQTVVDSSFAKLSVYASNIGNWKRYTGQEHALPSSFGDPWYFYRARVYRADAGRLLQRDPLNYVDSSNLYSYAMASPVVYFDPYGTDSQCTIILRQAKQLCIELCVLVSLHPSSEPLDGQACKNACSATAAAFGGPLDSLCGLF